MPRGHARIVRCSLVVARIWRITYITTLQVPAPTRSSCYGAASGLHRGIRPILVIGMCCECEFVSVKRGFYRSPFFIEAPIQSSGKRMQPTKQVCIISLYHTKVMTAVCLASAANVFRNGLLDGGVGAVRSTHIPWNGPPRCARLGDIRAHSTGNVPRTEKHRRCSRC
jgi:hypothetical protein